MGIAEALFDTGADPRGCSAVEIGSGWVPIVPLVMWLCGQELCHTYDISRLLKRSLLVRSLRQLGTQKRVESLLQTDRHKARCRERAGVLAELARSRSGTEAILSRCGIQYHAPEDAAATGLPSATMDLVYSNTVLEHVHPEVLSVMFAEAFRILRPGGHMAHLIDLTDHFSHGDPSISQIHFLRYSEAAFARYNSPFLYQNRLPARRWREIMEGAGFEIRLWQPRRSERILQILPSFPLDSGFTHLSAEELSISSLCVVARRP